VRGKQHFMWKIIQAGNCAGAVNPPLMLDLDGCGERTLRGTLHKIYGHGESSSGENCCGEEAGGETPQHRIFVSMKCNKRNMQLRAALYMMSGPTW
jgi:hypothetical protein